MNDDFLLDEPLQKYKLVNVNGDNIPELYINFGSTAGGDMLCSYFDNSVIYQPMWNYGFSYIEGENLFLDSGGHMDEYYDIDLQHRRWYFCCTSERRVWCRR